MKNLFGLCLVLSFFVYHPANAQAMHQPAQTIAVDASAATITTAAYVQLSAAMTANCTQLEVFNSTAKVLFLATGAASSEINIPYDFPPSSAALNVVNIPIKKGVRLSVKALTADATTGFLVVNCLQ